MVSALMCFGLEALLRMYQINKQTRSNALDFKDQGEDIARNVT